MSESSGSGRGKSGSEHDREDDVRRGSPGGSQRSPSQRSPDGSPLCSQPKLPDGLVAEKRSGTRSATSSEFRGAGGAARDPVPAVSADATRQRKDRVKAALVAAGVDPADARVASASAPALLNALLRHGGYPYLPDDALGGRGTTNGAAPFFPPTARRRCNTSWLAGRRCWRP
jgi:hypothetical protein